MSLPHTISPKELGMVRIYMLPKDTPAGSRKSLFGTRPLYRELVLAAKSFGLINAVAHHTHFGYSNHGIVHVEGAEIPNPNLAMWVELIDQRDQLENFCRKHAAWLREKVIIYKNLERWDIAEQSPSTAEIGPLQVARAG